MRKIFFCLTTIVCLMLGFYACDEPMKKIDEPITPEKMIGTWYLVDRGPNLDSAITACEKREYLVFKADSSAMRHQDCLPKTDNLGTWEIVDGKCMIRMDIVFDGVQVSNTSEQIEFQLVATDKIKVQKQFPLFLAWGIYQKVQ